MSRVRDAARLAGRKIKMWSRGPLVRVEQKIRGYLEERGHVSHKIARDTAQLRMAACMRPDAPHDMKSWESRPVPLSQDASYRHYPPMPPVQPKGALTYTLVQWPPGHRRHGGDAPDLGFPPEARAAFELAIMGDGVLDEERDEDH